MAWARTVPVCSDPLRPRPAAFLSLPAARRPYPAVPPAAFGLPVLSPRGRACRRSRMLATSPLFSKSIFVPRRPARVRVRRRALARWRVDGFGIPCRRQAGHRPRSQGWALADAAQQMVVRAGLGDSPRRPPASWADAIATTATPAPTSSRPKMPRGARYLGAGRAAWPPNAWAAHSRNAYRTVNCDG